MDSSRPESSSSPTHLLTFASEEAWLRLGSLAESMQDNVKASFCFENVLRQNAFNLSALSQLAKVCRDREQYQEAIVYYQRMLTVDSSNGDVWSALGHCYLMVDELQKTYSAYQQALYTLQNPKDPHLWYGIGILYDRYGSHEHAEEAFLTVLKMCPEFDKKNELYFRLGIIYKQRGETQKSLQFFKDIQENPPAPLARGDVWFQMGHLYELSNKPDLAMEAYEKVLSENMNNAKVLQQLAWLNHTTGNQEEAIPRLLRSVDIDSTDGHTWYLLGRCYMVQRKFLEAYDAYQQAVYRDGDNPTFWCSIGVLYYQINQHRDALDAYSRAIHLNPDLSEVWFNLGTLYESCDQLSDSLDAYKRAAELDSANDQIKERIMSINRRMTDGDGSMPAKPLSSVLSHGAAAQSPTPHSSNGAHSTTLVPPLSMTPSKDDGASGTSATTTTTTTTTAAAPKGRGEDASPKDDGGGGHHGDGDDGDVCMNETDQDGATSASGATQKNGNAPAASAPPPSTAPEGDVGDETDVHMADEEDSDGTEDDDDEDGSRPRDRGEPDRRTKVATTPTTPASTTVVGDKRKLGGVEALSKKNIEKRKKLAEDEESGGGE